MKISSHIQKTIIRGSFLWLVIFFAGIIAVLLPRTAISKLTRSENAAPSAVAVRQITLATTDLIYDPGTQRIYASVPSSAGVIGNSITQIDPVPGTIGASVSIGSEPGKLAISDNSQYIYASLDGVAAVRRFELATQTAGLQFSVGTGSLGTFFAEDIAVQPGQPDVVAISRMYSGLSPRHGGVGIYDNGVVRPITTPTHTGSNVIEFSATASTLYGYNNETTEFGTRNMAVDASGVSVVTTTRRLISGFGVNIVHDSGLLYTTTGLVINPETQTQVGTFAGLGGGALVLPDSSVNRVYFLTGSGASTTLRVFDQTTFLQTGSLAIPGVSGTPGSLIKWGADGLAFRTSGNQIFLVSTSEIVPIVPTPIPSPTQLAPGVIRLPLQTNDLVYDSNTQRVFASLPSGAGTFGNSIAPINPVDGTMGTPVFVGSEPAKLAISANGQYIYAELSGAGAVRNFDVASQTAGLQFALGNDQFNGPYQVDDMAVVPGDPNAVAVSRRNVGLSPRHEGVGIYDSGVVRTNVTPGHTGSNVIEFSSSPATLYGYNNETSEFGFRRMVVNASGVTVTSTTSTPISGFGVDIKYDNGRIYASTGQVIEPETATPGGTFPGVNTLAFVPDSSVNRAFYVTGTGASATLQAFDLTTFLPAGSANISGVSGTPGSLVRWGLNGLAFRTTAGQVFFIRTPLIPSAINLIVNDAGDAADNNVGDNLCDTSATPGNQCTLRAAIQETNADAATQNSILFDPSLNGSTITLASALPDISSNVNITGPGAGLLTVRRSSAGGTPNFRIFTTSANQTVAISGLTITNGQSAATVDGGGIFNAATLTLSDVRIIANQSGGNGGGIHNSGSLTLNSCNVTDNLTPGGNSGGGIYNHISTTLTITNTNISGNRTGNSTGGAGGYGGGVYNLGSMLVTGSTISNNQTGVGSMTGGYGAGIFNAATLSVTNSTVSGNQTGNAGNPEGGGIQNVGTLTINNSTISNNSALGPFAHGGGLNNVSGTITLQNTIVSGNFRINSSTADDISGSVVPSSSFNLIGTGGSGGLSNGVNNNQVGVVDPHIGPLANNGGPTLTHALLFGSPAIDAGNSSLTTDQRGQLRPIDDANVVNAAGSNASDIGAFEAHIYQVNSIADITDGACTPLSTGNGCTLREAINAANTDLGSEAITFAPALTSGGPATIVLLSALADLSSDMSISGPGANLLTVQRSTAGGTPNFRIFKINSGNMVSISGLTISNGNAPSGVFPANSGGAILNSGSLTLNTVIVSSNTANAGGGISTLGPLTLKNTLVSGNTASSAGGGISSQVQGGGGPVTIEDSSISGNNVVTGSGGGILNSLLGGTLSLTVTNSTIAGNSATAGNGGGIYNSGSQGAIINVTFTGATISGNTSGFGGGIANNSQGPGTAVRLTITNGTISGNNVVNSNSVGGGIANNQFGSTNTLTLHNTIVASNFRNSDATTSDISSPVDPTSSFNLIGDGTGSSGVSNGSNGNQVGTSLLPINPRLGPLANNGGLTQTHALLLASTALDAGNNALVVNPPFSGPPFTDQRGAGFARIVDGPDGDTTDTVDIGAFEAQVSVADIADQTINEDGSLSLPFNVGGTPSITSVTATSSDPLVPNNPANISISGSGSTRTLLITPVANAFGTSTITVTVNGNNSQAMTDTFLLTVNPVNDAPSFTKGVDQTVNENDGAQTVNNWATGIAAGPANESGQTVNFVIVSNSNSSLFSVGPAISLTGTLSYAPATGVSGTALITITLMDNGETTNGGVNTSATQSFNINVQEGGALQFNSATFSKAEDGGNAVITITRTGGTAGEARVNYATSNGTAIAGQDYSAASGTLIFPDGVATQSFNVAITNDALYEPDESVNLTLTSPAGSGSLGSPASAVLTINDNDPAPGISINDVTVSEGHSGTVNATFTVSLSSQISQTVTVNFATANDTATAGSDYQANSGTVTFLPLETTKPITVTVNGDVNFEENEHFLVNLSSPVNATISDNQGLGSILNDDAEGGFISFSQSSYTVGESDGFTTITVIRTNDLSRAVTIDYFTSDYSVVACNTVSGVASSRCDYTSSLGKLRFEVGESSKTFLVLISQDNYVENPESLGLMLSNATGGVGFAEPSSASLTITDDATEPATNPIDTADAFVRQHYHDFLNREADAPGLAFWSNQITECQQPGATCSAEVRRINVSAAFFLSIEFQETGFLVYRMAKAGYGNLPGLPVPLRLSTFLPDTQQIGKGVVVGQAGWEQQLESNKQAFALDFVSRSQFTTAYATTLTPQQLVDALFTNAAVIPLAADRDAAVNEFAGAGNTADTAARSRALRRIAENSSFKQQETNRAFVLMQYFGYLRRNPDDAPEANLNFDGYNFWLAKLNEFNGNFVNAEMVKAFLVSSEYRQRFGP